MRRTVIPPKLAVVRIVSCAWCCEEFEEILDLLAHVEACHLPAAEAA